MPFVFWQRWLLAVCLGSVAVGILMVLGPFSPPMLPYVQNVARAFWGAPELPPDAVAHYAWSQAAFGSAVAGWGASLALVAAGPFRRRDPMAPWIFRAGIAVWIPLDTIWSWRAGVTLEVLFNLGALVAFAVPLVATRRAFRSAGEPSPAAE